MSKKHQKNRKNLYRDIECERKANKDYKRKKQRLRESD